MNADAELLDDIDEVIVTEEQITKRLDDLASEITSDYAGEHLLFIGVLKGAFILMADLVRRVELPTSVDFMACTSYGSGTRSSGTVRILKDLDVDISGQHVLLVEDVVDSGLTLDYLLKNLRSRRPASIEVLAFLDKPSRRRVEIPIRYLGFEVPDVFVVGYGLDYAQRYRNLPFVGTLKPAVYESE
jgi:hypoxanthine phosphoribosyltransferase